MPETKRLAVTVRKKSRRCSGANANNQRAFAREKHDHPGAARSDDRVRSLRHSISTTLKELHMKLISASLFLASLFASSTAFAGPPVTVSFKNVGTTTAASYTLITANEISTYANASPKPVASVAAGQTDVYNVTSLISPDANYAVVRYRMGTKECVFSTTFVNALQPGGFKVPTWNKSATPSGGAICTATITSVNAATYAWTVSFTMK
jgi:hypothetical protein